MNERQRRFADEYIISGNAYQSALKAGYSEKYSKARSSELLENVGIKSYIDERLDKLKSEKIANQTEILEFLTSAMRGEVTEPILKNSGDFEQIVVDVKPNVATRKAAAELLGKRYGMWVDKQDVTTNNVTEIIWDIPIEDEG
ncbi:terminase small subunit [Streptococcus suis]|nr:terminase small subunit [Streptococcus suis]